VILCIYYHFKLLFYLLSVLFVIIFIYNDKMNSTDKFFCCLYISACFTLLCTHERLWFVTNNTVRQIFIS